MNPLKQQTPVDLQAAQKLILSLQQFTVKLNDQLSVQQKIIQTKDQELQTKDQELQTKDQELQTKDQELQNKNSHIKILEEKLKLAIAKRFVRSSEKFAFIPDGKTPYIQENLFDEADFPSIEKNIEESAAQSAEGNAAEQTETIEVPAHTRTIRRGKRIELPSYLPVVRIEHTLSAEELIGSNGELFEKIGEIISKQLDVIPATVQVLEHVRFQYAVKGKEELGIRTASLPKQPIPKSIASPGLLANIAVNKYSYHLPLYRQEKIWNSLDVNLPDNTLGRWMIQVGELVQPLVDYLMEEIKLHRHIHADETPVTLINNKPKQDDINSHQGYMWLYMNHKGAIYDYRESRSGEHPKEMLSEFNGYLQTDAYAGYNPLLSSNKNIISVGCFAHARRYFMDIKKTAGKKAKTPTVDHVLNLIGKLYHIESQAKKNNLSEENIYRERQEKAIPILKKLYAYLIETKPKSPPNGALGKAIAYSLNHWKSLHRYTEDGCLSIDNNPAERLIKPFVIGKKNWMFCGNVRGAKASANIYSLIESAKLYELKVFDYLKYVFENIPLADTPRKLEQLLPQYAQAIVPKTKDFSQHTLPSANKN